MIIPLAFFITVTKYVRTIMNGECFNSTKNHTQNPQTSKPFSPDKNGKRTQDVIIITII